MFHEILKEEMANVNTDSGAIYLTIDNVVMMAVNRGHIQSQVREPCRLVNPVAIRLQLTLQGLSSSPCTFVII